MMESLPIVPLQEDHIFEKWFCPRRPPSFSDGRGEHEQPSERCFLESISVGGVQLQGHFHSVLHVIKQMIITLLTM